MGNHAARRTSPFQFSLRSLLLVTTLCGVLFAGYFFLEKNIQKYKELQKVKHWEQNLNRREDGPAQLIIVDLRNRSYCISTAEVELVAEIGWVYQGKKILPPGVFYASPPGKKVKSIEEAFDLFYTVEGFKQPVD